MTRTIGSSMPGVRYYSLGLSELDAEILACVCGRATAEAYLQADARDYAWMRARVAHYAHYGPRPWRL